MIGFSVGLLTESMISLKLRIMMPESMGKIQLLVSWISMALRFSMTTGMLKNQFIRKLMCSIVLKSVEN